MNLTPELAAAGAAIVGFVIAKIIDIFDRRDDKADDRINALLVTVGEIKTTCVRMETKFDLTIKQMNNSITAAHQNIRKLREDFENAP